MFPGIDPRKLAETQSITKNVTGVIIVDYKGHSVLLKLETGDEAAKKALPQLLESFSQALAQQLGMFFAIQGKIIERNK